MSSGGMHWTGLKPPDEQFGTETEDGTFVLGLYKLALGTNISISVQEYKARQSYLL